MENPFKYGGVVRRPFFADRKEELAELAREMSSLSKVFLISPRRYGKSSLLVNLLEEMEGAGFATAYIDLNAYADLRSFAAGFAQITSRSLESNAEKLVKILSGLKRLRPKVQVGPDGSISAGVEAPAGEKEAIPALIEGMQQAELLARRKERRLIVVIDEFSDLDKYDGRTVEKALRSEIQQQEAIGYILSGSEESIMLSMVRDKKRAFYRMGRIMELGPIPREAYLDFIFQWFREGGYAVEKEDLEAVIGAGQDVPYNVQRLCHVLWDQARADMSASPELIGRLPGMVARQDSPHFELLWHTATPQQKNLLMALAKEPDAKPFSKDFQFSFSIGPSSSIKASLDSLVRKGILYRTTTGTYRFSDIFMRHWILSLRQPPLRT